MNTSIFLVACSVACVTQAALPELEAPIQLTTNNGQPIELHVGCAAPALLDMNGDGKKDLVVGEFGKMAQGRARVYLNVGSDATPVFNDFSYLKAGGVDAVVPSSCCIGFDPSFIDLNGDGILDVTSGQYEGGLINFYQGVKPSGDDPGLKFLAGVTIPESGMSPYDFSWLMRTANFIDYDQDGDFDMVSGDLQGHAHIAFNTGGVSTYRFESRQELTAGGKPILVEGKSDPLPVDWDGDGILDLLVASESSDVLFFRGKRKAGTDFEPGASIWSDRVLVPGSKPDYFDAQERLEALGDKRPYPGYRTRLTVADWNNDGKQDLLVGNTFDPETVESEEHAEAIGHVYLFLRK